VGALADVADALQLTETVPPVALPLTFVGAFRAPAWLCPLLPLVTVVLK
jgi:hypothetical protein